MGTNKEACSWNVLCILQPLRLKFQWPCRKEVGRGFALLPLCPAEPGKLELPRPEPSTIPSVIYFLHPLGNPRQGAEGDGQRRGFSYHVVRRGRGIRSLGTFLHILQFQNSKLHQLSGLAREWQRAGPESPLCSRAVHACWQRSLSTNLHLLTWSAGPDLRGGRLLTPRGVQGRLLWPSLLQTVCLGGCCSCSRIKKGTKKLPNYGGGKNSLKTKKIVFYKKLKNLLEDICLVYSEEMKS